jgi:purine-nucleoside phosphorylase
LAQEKTTPNKFGVAKVQGVVPYDGTDRTEKGGEISVLLKGMGFLAFEINRADENFAIGAMN